MDFRTMDDTELWDKYITISVALQEHGHTDNLVNAYIGLTKEVCLRYFDERGLAHRKESDELWRSVIHADQN